MKSMKKYGVQEIEINEMTKIDGGVTPGVQPGWVIASIVLWVNLMYGPID